MDYDLEEFLDEYDDNTNQVARADYKFFPARLKQWFYLLDKGDETIASHIRWLEGQVDWVTDGEQIAPRRKAWSAQVSSIYRQIEPEGSRPISTFSRNWRLERYNFSGLPTIIFMAAE